MNVEKNRFIVNETCIDATIETGFLKYVGEFISEARSIIESKIDSDPVFGTTLDIYSSSEKDENLIKNMCRASALAGVGPMASVAGAVASYVLESLKRKGCDHAIIDNGGDLAIYSCEPIVVGLYTINQKFNNIGIRIQPSDTPIGIASSSGTIGHSLSFGNSDISTVFSKDPILADACATSLGNKIHKESDINSSIESICLINGVDGCIAVIGDSISICGTIPEIVHIDRN